MTQKQLEDYILIRDKDITEPAIPCPTIIKLVIELFIFDWGTTIFYSAIRA